MLMLSWVAFRAEFLLPRERERERQERVAVKFSADAEVVEGGLLRDDWEVGCGRWGVVG